MASCHNSLLLLAFLIAFSLSFCSTSSSARILTTSDEQAPTENSLFKKIPGIHHHKHKLFKKPPFAPKLKVPHHPKLPEHTGVPKVDVPKPKSKFDPPKFKVPPKSTVHVSAHEGENKQEKSKLVNEGSKFSTGIPSSGLPNFGLPPFLSSPSIPYPDFIPLVPAIPLTPQSEDSKVKSTGHDQHRVAP